MNTTSWNPAASAASTTVSVTSNTSWSVTRSQTWLTVSPASGSNNGSFSISATANIATSAKPELLRYRAVVSQGRLR
ncbi:MAG: hypothetical protein LBC86_04715 [Oscillospiraceae bacterium]|nr:hypothetical protein [Oscillospiraceae bacterium]